jgi:predicted aspartyl protease
LPDIFGHVDARGRPIVSLTAPDGGDELLVVVDTGFNGTLLFHDNEISRRKCEVITHLEEMVEFADGERRPLLLGRTNVSWFGRPLTVDVLISQSERSRAVLADEPIGLLGTALLSQHKLTIDFAAHRVVITE